jgi:hypothetical protein
MLDRTHFLSVFPTHSLRFPCTLEAMSPLSTHTCSGWSLVAYPFYFDKLYHVLVFIWERLLKKFQRGEVVIHIRFVPDSLVPEPVPCVSVTSVVDRFLCSPRNMLMLNVYEVWQRTYAYKYLFKISFFFSECIGERRVSLRMSTVLCFVGLYSFYLFIFNF